MTKYQVSVFGHSFVLTFERYFLKSVEYNFMKKFTPEADNRKKVLH
jgi:hypothetical protein